MELFKFMMELDIYYYGPEKYDAIYNRIRYLLEVKSGIIYVTSHNYARMKIGSYDSLPLEKTMI